MTHLPESPATPSSHPAEPPAAAFGVDDPLAGAGGTASSGHPRVPRLHAGRSGVAALVVGVLLLLVMGFTPTAYVLRMPGPVYNAIGEVTLQEGEDPTPVISISGATTYEPESGVLDVMTINVAGSPLRMPGWVEAFTSYLTDERDVLPIEMYYPDGQTADDRSAVNESMMLSSQSEAIAAALTHQGYEVGLSLFVSAVEPEGPSAGILEPDDRILAVDGTAIDRLDGVRAALAGNEGTPVTVTVLRDGQTLDLDITPTLGEVDGETRPLLGIVVAGEYEFPIDVEIQLGDVGGPSAGLIFSLAIIDKLTPGDLTGGHHIAGTGTIAGDGEVGPIGGIRQKLHAAAANGAEGFLAPVDNCAEALDGGVPGGLPVYAVTTLDEAVTVVETIASGGDTSALPTCQTVSRG